MKTKVKPIVILVGVFAGATAYCADITWDNSSGDNLWSTPENWKDDKLPGDSDRAKFTGDDIVVVDSAIRVGAF